MLYSLVVEVPGEMAQDEVIEAVDALGINVVFCGPGSLVAVSVDGAPAALAGLAVGDLVEEAPRRVPPGCVAQRGRVKFVAADGWVGVEFSFGVLSFPPGDVVRVTG